MFSFRRISNMAFTVPQGGECHPGTRLHEAQCLLHNHASLLPAGGLSQDDFVVVSGGNLMAHGRRGVVRQVSTQALMVELDSGKVRIFLPQELTKLTNDDDEAAA
ncbi:hypothetical protein [Verrucomicrobium sp. BvORR034]|uniref:hypothetical protein n=1 Tax=Verrucomicrobium sp. BvORR034 TaxID=1396418 RepID=UPI002240FC7C|nr:hypothetical protein [Verrucomicrobium sp. BvORR034]